MKMAVAVLLLSVNLVQASEIQWTRFIGTIKAVNSKSQMLTIEDQQGDLLSLHIDADVDVLKGKDPVGKFIDLKLGDKITLLYNPKAPEPKDPDQPVNGIYPK